MYKSEVTSREEQTSGRETAMNTKNEILEEIDLVLKFECQRNPEVLVHVG